MKDTEPLDYSSEADLNAKERRDHRREHAILMRRGITLTILLGLIVFFVRVGLDPEAELSGVDHLALRLLLPLLVMGWCLFDGRVREQVPTRAGLVGIFIVAPLGFVTYCLWSRGWRGFLPILYVIGAFFLVGVSIMVLFEFMPGFAASEG